MEINPVGANSLFTDVVFFSTKYISARTFCSGVAGIVKSRFFYSNSEKIYCFCGTLDGMSREHMCMSRECKCISREHDCISREHKCMSRECMCISREHEFTGKTEK